jgi:2-hydroxy-6-oxonona-2,4-dienedioate hydrolase
MSELTESDTSQFVQTKKWRLHYNAAGTGHPVVMLHGSGPGASGWSNFKTTLVGLSPEYRAIAVDMPGWGKSDTAPADDRDHVEALVLFLDELGIDRAAVIGNSMGGATALRFAVEHPDRISHLIPMGAPGPGPNLFVGGDPRGSEGMRVLLAAYRDPSPANFKALVSVMAFDPRFASDALAEERSKSALANPEHLTNFLDAIAAGTPAGPASAMINAQQQLTQVQTPTLVVHGRNDRTLPYENALRLVAHIPNSRLLLLNQCGHWAQLEHAGEFNRAVASFIANN